MDPYLFCLAVGCLSRQVIPGRGTRRASIRVTDSFRKASTTEDHEKAEQEEEEDGGSDSGDSMDFLSADDVRSCVTEDAYIKTIRSTAVTTAPFGLSQELARTYIDGRAGVTAGGGGAATRRLADTSRAAVDGDAVAGEVDEVPLSQYGMLVGPHKTISNDVCVPSVVVTSVSVACMSCPADGRVQGPFHPGQAGHRPRHAAQVRVSPPSSLARVIRRPKA